MGSCSKRKPYAFSSGNTKSAMCMVNIFKAMEVMKGVQEHEQNKHGKEF